jgi:outer membrane protein assembly factor BamE (lipoprotein component of BamABCDE complex)
MKMKNMLLTIACSAALSACTLGNLHNNQSIAEINSQSQARSVIKRGMTKDQVQAKLGKPFENQTFNNQTTWTYQTSGMNIDGTAVLAGVLGGGVPRRDLKRVSITFNGTGRVTRVDYVELQN